jgi:hypothetical protein
MKAKKADPNFRKAGEGDTPRVKQIAKKTPGTLPKKSFENMDTDKEEENDAWEPDDEKRDTDQKAGKKQTGDRQNSADGGKLEVVAFKIKAPSEALNTR